MAMRMIRAMAITAAVAACPPAQASPEAAQALVHTLRHRLTDRDFAKVAAATSMTELDLSGCRGLSKDALQQLHGMQSLRKLSLASAGRLVDGVEHLGAMSALRVLDLSSNKEYTGAGLASLTQLRELNLNRCDAIQDRHLQALHGLRDLATLRLYGCHKIKDRGFNDLFAKLPSLHTLELAFCWWHEGHELHWPEHLVHLDLHESKRLVDAAIIAIPNKQGLRTLNLFQCLVLTDRSLEALRGLTELDSLDIGSIRALTDEGMAHVATLTGLTHLGLCDNANITGSGVRQLASLTKLEELNLWHCEALTDDGLVACASMPAMRRLVLSSCGKVGDAGLRHLLGLRSLRQLHLDGCHGVTVKGVEQLESLLLRELTLKGCSGIDDAAVNVLAKMQSLRYLDLRDCANVTASALMQLRLANPDCVVRP
ncbi:MAG: F-box/leucine-rich repeat protein 14 [Hyphomicrobiaceae bacterium]|jgi:F-box/leucine-rich repeat protein 14